MRLIFLVTVFLLTIFIGISRISDKDRVLYQQILESSDPSRKQQDQFPFSQQIRESVSKQIWYQDEAPLFFCIDSTESQLFVFQKDNQYEVIEELSNVKCIMQEELFFVQNDDIQIPMQRVRYLEAEKAFYNYNSQLFVAEEVQLWQYQIEGHEPKKDFSGYESMMEGTANSIEFTLSGKKLEFLANKMKANFQHKEINRTQLHD